VKDKGSAYVVKSPRMERKQQETHQRIKEAARALFMEESGYESATVRKIADRADVSVGTVYLHFRSKSEILAELVNEFQTRTLEELTAGLSEELSGLEQLKAFFTMFGRITSDGRAKPFIQFLIQLGSLGFDKEVIEMALEPYIDKYIAILARTLAKGATDGSFPRMEGNPRLLATILFQCIEGLTIFNFNPQKSQRFMVSDFPVDELFSQFIGLVLGGLGEGEKRGEAGSG
jgi:AcrR family transcriptional regulator